MPIIAGQVIDLSGPVEAQRRADARHRAEIREFCRKRDESKREERLVVMGVNAHMITQDDPDGQAAWDWWINHCRAYGVAGD